MAKLTKRAKAFKEKVEEGKIQPSSSPNRPSSRLPCFLPSFFPGPENDRSSTDQGGHAHRQGNQEESKSPNVGRGT